MTNARVLAQSASNNTTFRNRIINGNMMIDQRNGGGAVTPSATGANIYFLDRWNYTPSQASKVTLQQSTTVPAGYSTSLSATVAAAVTPGAADYFGIAQFIEGNNVADLDYGKSTAQTTTLSFWVRSSVTGTYSVQFQNSAQNRSYIATYTVNSANTWEQKSITVPGCTDGTWLTGTGKAIAIWFDLGSGSNFNGTAGQWNNSNTIRTSGSVNWISNAGATFYITGVQLEKGTAASTFENRQYGTELALCQRYYWKGTINAGGVFGGASGSIPIVAWAYPVSMRAAPTFAWVSGGSTSNGNVALNITGVTTANTYTESAQILWSQSGSSGANAQGAMTTAAVSSFSAEL